MECLGYPLPDLKRLILLWQSLMGNRPLGQIPEGFCLRIVPNTYPSSYWGRK